MKKLALGTLMLAGLLAACGGDDGPSIVDGGIDAPDTAACNPNGAPGAQGCLAGQKCTWIQIQDTPEALGKLGCVPDGTVQLDGACTVGAVGETTGFDDCAAGLYCINNVCKDVCGFDGAAGSACQSGYNCTRYSDTFANGDDDPVAGVCNPGCDPITQIKAGTNPPTNCGANMGCYMLVSQTNTIAVCAGTPPMAPTHNQDIVGDAFANSCVPGAQPRAKDSTSQTVQCGGLCKVTDVYMGMNEASEAGETTAAAGDKDNCTTAWSAAPPSDGSAGESCRYWWSREPFDTISSYSNTVGYCYKHAVFQYDTNGDMTDDAQFPRCTTLTTGDVVPPIGNPTPHNDAMYFWCIQLPPPMLQGAVRNIKQMHARHEPRIDRLVDWSRHAQ